MSKIESQNSESSRTVGSALRRPAKGPKVAVAQIEPALGDVEANIEKHRDAVGRAREAGADLLVFPELSMTGYRLKDQVPDVAAAENGPLFELLGQMSQDVAILVGLVTEARNYAFHNSAAYFEGGRRRAMHHKVYLPTYGMFEEQRYFARGDRVRAFDTKHGRMGVLICEDMLHPSALMIAALDGAAVMLVPSASPAHGVTANGDVDANGRHWENYNRTMARNFGLFVVHANRVGVEDGYTFWGGSEIVGPDGETLAKAAYYEPDFITATLPLEAMRRRRIQAPVLRDENVDLTINELCRLRGRAAPARDERGASGRRDDRRGDRRDDWRGGGRDSRRGAEHVGAGPGGAGPRRHDPEREEADVPARMRPEAGAHKPRPVGERGGRRGGPKRRA